MKVMARYSHACILIFASYSLAAAPNAEKTAKDEQKASESAQPEARRGLLERIFGLGRAQEKKAEREEAEPKEEQPVKD